MSEAYLDAGFPEHRKVRRLRDTAFRLHVSALCWAAKYGTDGVVPEEDLDLIGGDLDEAGDPTSLKEAVAQLVEQGLWHEVGGVKAGCAACVVSHDGYVIHDFAAIPHEMGR